MAFHANPGSRTDSSSGLMTNLTPTEELNDNEPVFFEAPVGLSSPSPDLEASGIENKFLSGPRPQVFSLSTSQQLSPWSARRTKDDEVEEDIYTDLCYVNLSIGRKEDDDGEGRTLEELPLTSSWTLPSEKRDYCVRELVDTEKNYIDALNMIIRHFVRPLKDVFPPKERRIIFLHIKDLSEIHRGFHQELFKACSCPPSSPSLIASSSSSNLLSSFPSGSISQSTTCYKISHVFLTWKEKFVIYGNYCTNLPKAQSLLDELCRQNESIGEAVTRCQQSSNDGKFKLRDLLALPMQRILKYHLLLNELIKSTLESHEDYTGLKKAHEAMLDLGQYINEIKRDSETLQIINDIEKSIVDLEMPPNTELKDYGRLLKDGEVKMRSFEVNKLKTRYVFVFDKVMLMCKPIRGDQYSYREALILADFRLVELALSTNVSNSAPFSLHREKSEHGFMLSHRLDPKIVYGFFVKSEEGKKVWIESLQKAHDNVCPAVASDHAFSLNTFPNPSTCYSCGNLLHGLFFQGYRCSVCRVGVHKKCISKVKSCGSCTPSSLLRTGLPTSASSFSPSLFQDLDLSSNRSESASMFGEDSSPASPSEKRFLEEQQWFVGCMTRDEAQAALEKSCHGAFLVRISPKQNNSFAISINFNGVVKHIRICHSEANHYFLSQTRHFRSVTELVHWYESHSLADSFQGLNVYLSHPCSKISRNSTPGISGTKSASSSTTTNRTTTATTSCSPSHVVHSAFDNSPLCPLTFPLVVPNSSCSSKVVSTPSLDLPVIGIDPNSKEEQDSSKIL